MTRLLEASQVKLVKEKVSLTPLASGYQIGEDVFDQVILATGAWLGDILELLGYEVDVRPQKGQLRDYQLSEDLASYPVVMPEGEWDLIPFAGGKLSLGATHENDMGFDLEVDKEQLDTFGNKAQQFLKELADAQVINERVGIRAYTSDYSPFYGEVPTLKNVFAASGLGSSGLTTGPIIGYSIANMILGRENELDSQDYDISSYITVKE